MCFCEAVPEGHSNYVLHWITVLRGGRLHASTHTNYAVGTRKGYRRETKLNVEKILTNCLSFSFTVIIDHFTH